MKNTKLIGVLYIILFFSGIEALYKSYMKGQGEEWSFNYHLCEVRPIQPEADKKKESNQ